MGRHDMVEVSSRGKRPATRSPSPVSSPTHSSSSSSSSDRPPTPSSPPCIPDLDPLPVELVDDLHPWLIFDPKAEHEATTHGRMHEFIRQRCGS
ncbi:hypothetical protein L1987_23230 [Smallanthus sonchifolius]|uniref:Uncharacterized protein n=1 Tax=Smallanthus sonchifolius TaxID=185202 RepID=A0ACB9IH83_9ASTR|nr:hypothetical protein L1987_23230 [Smallanthus sonchifolius]